MRDRHRSSALHGGRFDDQHRFRLSRRSPSSVMTHGRVRVSWLFWP